MSAARTPSMVLSMAFVIQPGGWALPADPGSSWGLFLAPMASAWSAIEGSMYSMLPQVDPRQATTLLAAWQAMLGADPCGRDALATTQAEQQALVYQRLTARGGQSIPYMLSLAANAGVSATITEATWFRFGAKRFGAGCFSAPGNQFNWSVNLPAATATGRVFGVARFADPFGSFSQSPAQCPITHAAPAHTLVGFNYTGTPLA